MTTVCIPHHSLPYSFIPPIFVSEVIVTHCGYTSYSQLLYMHAVVKDCSQQLIGDNLLYDCLFSFSVEIEATLSRLKKLEKDLTGKEKELHEVGGYLINNSVKH